MITVANKKRSIERIQKEHPGAYILDITSSSPYHYGQMLSPFFPHRNIPIPGDSRGMKATCVEAIWQGLKVFEDADIDIQMFQNDTMRNIKRTVRKYGKPLGHRFGVFSDRILNYADARRLIYIPSYKYVLDNILEVHRIVERIKEKARESDIVLLDYNLNPGNLDLSKPLSHAELVKMYIEGCYPDEENFVQYTKEELKEKKAAYIKRPPKTRVDALSLENEAVVINQIIEILSNSERTARQLCELLAINGDGNTVRKLFKKIPNITSRPGKAGKIYTIGDFSQSSDIF